MGIYLLFMSFTYEYDEFIGKESLDIEHKEFTFNSSGLVLNYKLAEDYCKNHHFNFNPFVINSLDRYFKQYLPKYTCAFINRNIIGNLYIGVNDFGFVKGIPYCGELPVSRLTENMYDIIEKSVKFTEPIDIRQHISIKFSKIQKPSIPETSLPFSYIEFCEKRSAYLDKYNAFLKKFDQWKTKSMFFTQKLVDLVNNDDSRSMIIQYIIDIDPSCVVIKILQSDYTLPYCDHEEISVLKDDPQNPYYWVCRWKDEMIEKTRKERPVFRDIAFLPATPYNIIIGAGEMIPYWMNFNDNMNLYIIHVTFNTIQTTDKIFYESYDKNWISCYRNVLSDGEPVCTPY